MSLSGPRGLRNKLCKVSNPCMLALLSVLSFSLSLAWSLSRSKGISFAYLSMFIWCIRKASISSDFQFVEMLHFSSLFVDIKQDILCLQAFSICSCQSSNLLSILGNEKCLSFSFFFLPTAKWEF